MKKLLIMALVAIGAWRTIIFRRCGNE